MKQRKVRGSREWEDQLCKGQTKLRGLIIEIKKGCKLGRKEGINQGDWGRSVTEKSVRRGRKGIDILWMRQVVEG